MGKVTHALWYQTEGRLLPFLPKPLGVLALLLLLDVLWSTWYIVGNKEQAVVQRFGKYVETTTSGPHLKLPWPIEKVTAKDVKTIRQIEVGYSSRREDGKLVFDDRPEEATMLTQDLNLALVDFAIQYRIIDLKQYLFGTKDPEQALALMGQSAMRLSVGGHSFDEVVTTGRLEIQQEAHERLQKSVNALGIGVQVATLQLQDAHPPKEVLEAFRDVNKAVEDRSRRTQEAGAYANKVLPDARGRAEKMINDAEGSKARRVAIAEGDAAQFLSLLEKYQANPEITRERLRLETATATLGGKPHIIDPTSQLFKFYGAGGVNPLEQKERAK